MKRFAIARPMPLTAPVMNAFLLLISNMFLILIELVVPVTLTAAMDFECRLNGRRAN